MDRLIILPNGTFETNYSFSSRDLEPGLVTFELLDQNNEHVRSNNQKTILFEPSEFEVIPNTTYSSRLMVTTSSDLSEQYQALQLVAKYFAHMNESKSSHLKYGNDTIKLWTGYVPSTSRCIHDRFFIENTTINIKKGTTHSINGTFVRSCSGLGEVTFVVSETPLNVTIIPSSFIAKKNMDFPVTFLISAPPITSPGFQTFNITILSPTIVDSLGGKTSIVYPKKYIFNVTIAENP